MNEGIKTRRCNIWKKTKQSYLTKSDQLQKESKKKEENKVVKKGREKMWKKRIDVI
jgi:hypothetical protein